MSVNLLAGMKPRKQRCRLATSSSSFSRITSCSRPFSAPISESQRPAYSASIASKALSSPACALERAAISCSLMTSSRRLGLAAALPMKEVILLRTSSLERRRRHSLRRGSGRCCCCGKWSRTVIQQARRPSICSFSALNSSTFSESGRAAARARRRRGASACISAGFKQELQNLILRCRRQLCADSGRSGVQEGGVQEVPREDGRGRPAHQDPGAALRGAREAGQRRRLPQAHAGRRGRGRRRQTQARLRGRQGGERAPQEGHPRDQGKDREEEEPVTQ